MSRFFDAYPNSPTLEPVVQKHLRRVYTSLTGALTAAAVGAIFNVYLITRNILWPATVASFLILPTILFFYFSTPNTTRRTLLFYTFAFIDGCASAPLLSTVADIDPRIPPLAFLATAAIFACFSVAAIFSKRGSYLYLNSFLMTGVLALSLGQFIPYLFPNAIHFTTYIYLGIMLFTLFILYDTQLIIEKAHAGDRDHLKHAIDLFIDFAAVFKRLMIIFASKEQDRRERDDRRERNSATM